MMVKGTKNPGVSGIRRIMAEDMLTLSPFCQSRSSIKQVNNSRKVFTALELVGKQVPFFFCINVKFQSS